MALQLSTVVRDARLDAIESTIGTTPILKIFSGSEPANCAAADPTGALLSITLPSDWMSAAAAGVKGLLGTWQANATATGNAASYRIYDSGGATCHLQGSVTATGGGGDLTVDNVSMASGQTITVTSYSWTEANP